MGRDFDKRDFGPLKFSNSALVYFLSEDRRGALKGDYSKGAYISNRQLIDLALGDTSDENIVPIL